MIVALAADGVGKVLVFDWHVRRYRRPFYELVGTRLAELGGQLEVAVIDPPPSMSARADSDVIPSDHLVGCRWFQVGGRDVVYRSTRKLIRDLRPDVIVTEQAVRNLDVFTLLWGRTRQQALVALIGHGMTHTGNASTPLEVIKRQITLRSDHFFAYTERGACWAEQIGLPRKRISVLKNSTDTRQLQKLIRSADEGLVRGLAKSAATTPGKTALFVGGLDGPKRLDMLLESSRLVAATDPEFRLLVAGTGMERPRIEEMAGEFSWLHYLGRCDGQELATVMRIADFIMIPDNVGLVATDSFGAAIPIVTTHGSTHGPEFEYLEDGRNAVITEFNIARYADVVINLLQDPARLDLLSANCAKDADNYSIESMADSFVEGIRRLVSAR